MIGTSNGQIFENGFQQLVGAAKNAVTPIEDIPSNYEKKVNESVEGMKKGIEELGEQNPKGIPDTLYNAFSYVGSPIEAAIDSLVGKPVEAATGIPREYTNFATGFMIPGFGEDKIKDMMLMKHDEVIEPLLSDLAKELIKKSGPAFKAKSPIVDVNYEPDKSDVTVPSSF